jgi:DNA-binding phage protein
MEKREYIKIRLIQQFGSISQAADELGLTRQTLYNVLSGSFCSWDTAHRIAEATGEKVDGLMNPGPWKK